jgi:hypothetical protein
LLAAEKCSRRCRFTQHRKQDVHRAISLCPSRSASSAATWNGAFVVFRKGGAFASVSARASSRLMWNRADGDG